MFLWHHLRIRSNLVLELIWIHFASSLASKESTRTSKFQLSTAEFLLNQWTNKKEATTSTTCKLRWVHNALPWQAAPRLRGCWHCLGIHRRQRWQKPVLFHHISPRCLGAWASFWVSSISGFFGSSVSFSALSLCYAILLWILSSLEFTCVAKNGKSIAIFSPYVLSRPSGKYWVGLPRFAKKMWPMPHMLFTSKTKLCQNMSKPSKYSKKNLGKINCRGSLCLCFDCLLMGSILDTMWVYHFHPSPAAWLWPPECKTQAACASFKLRSACAHDEVWKLWKLEISGSIIGSTLKYLVMLHAPWSVISSW